MNDYKNIYDSVFHSPGYSKDLHLSEDELTIFKEIVEKNYLNIISNLDPSIKKKFAEVGIQNYHKISHLIDHSSLWGKLNRCLPIDDVNKIKDLKFIENLRLIFGDFTISNIVHGQTVFKNSEEIYWRLVRPSIATDVGPLHADKWFHEVATPNYIPAGYISLKVWIPIYCEPGKNGLLMIPDSHKRNWKHSFITNSFGQQKPVPNECLPTPILINTVEGNMVIFPDGTIHGGALNEGSSTRVSVEITLLFKKLKSY